MRNNAAQLGSVAGAQGAVKHVDVFQHWSRPSRPAKIDEAIQPRLIARLSQDASNDVPNRASSSWNMVKAASKVPQGRNLGADPAGQGK